MSKSPRVSNLSRRFSIDFKQAERAVEVCAAMWVEYGVSIRDVTLAEAIQLRNQQAARRECLAYAELPGLVYEPSASGQESFRREPRLVAEAGVFAEHAVAFAR